MDTQLAEHRQLINMKLASRFLAQWADERLSLPYYGYPEPEFIVRYMQDCLLAWADGVPTPKPPF